MTDVSRPGRAHTDTDTDTDRRRRLSPLRHVETKTLVESLFRNKDASLRRRILFSILNSVSTSPPYVTTGEDVGGGVRGRDSRDSGLGVCTVYTSRPTEGPSVHLLGVEQCPRGRRRSVYSLRKVETVCPHPNGLSPRGKVGREAEGFTLSGSRQVV